MKQLTDLWAWTSEKSGEEGIIAAYMPGLGMTTLVTGNFKLTEPMGQLARRADPNAKLRHYDLRQEPHDGSF